VKNLGSKKTSLRPGDHDMNILGHGIDLVDVQRVASLLSKNDDFLFGWFTSREIEALAERVSQPPVVAGRVAAKEAVVKALGSGFNDEVSWQDVEILTTEGGSPTVHLSGGAAYVAAASGVSSVLLSITHDVNMSAASAIAVGVVTDRCR
jgi:holo-[acyl-carrier protein] synthase